MRGSMRTDQSQSTENSHPDTPSFRQNLTFFQKAVQIGSGVRRSDATSSSTSTIVGSGARVSDGRRSACAPTRRSSISSDDSSAQSVESQEEESSGGFDLPPPPVAFSGVRPRPVTSEQTAPRIGRDSVTSEQTAPRIGRDSVTSVASSRPAVGGRASTEPARAVRAEKGSRVRIGGTASERVKSGGKHRSQQASGSQTQEEFVREDRPSRISSAVEEEVQPPRRKPYIRFNSVEKSLNHDDLTYFKQTIGIVPGTELSITRTQSCNEGLDQQTVRTSSSTGVSRTLSYSSLAEAERREGATGSGGGSSLKRVPSVDEILESVKALRARRQELGGEGSGREMVKTTAEPEAEYQNLDMKRGKTGSSGAHMTSWSNPKFQNLSSRVVEDPDEGYENIPPGELCYENLSSVQSSAEVIYDQPVSSRLRKHQGSLEPEQPTYMNLSAADPAEMLYENVEKGSVSISGNGMVTSAQYDVPRTASHIYDSPQKSSGRARQQQLPVETTYDTPRTTRGHGGSAGHHRLTQIQINGETELSQSPDSAECDRDSLEGTSPRAPDIPSPDYASDGDQDVDGIPDDYVGDDQLDEGLGESDARSYYNEDPAGLEVILEEPEDEYVTSSEEEEEIHCPSRSLGSLDGSEGIGSAEGDSGSNASVESSSGVHSTEGSPMLHADTDKEDRVQKDRCVEVYPETMRQRKHSKKPKPIDIKQWKETSDAVAKEEIGSRTLDNPARAKKLLPSVKALKSQFEPSAGVEGLSRGTKSSRTLASGKERAPAPPKRTQSPDDRSKNISVGETLVARKDTSPRARGQGSAGKPAAVPKQLTSPNSPSLSQPVGRASSKHQQVVVETAVEPIFDQFSEVDERLLRPGIATLKWNPTPLVNRLYELPDPARKSQGQEKGYINIEGWLEKLPSGRKKATFWNAWKRRYFKAKDGYLYYYQSNTTEKPSMVVQLMGGHVELSDNSVIGVDDGKGHYVVVRCSNEQESERWSRALLSHTVEDFSATYIQPVSLSAAPSISRRCVVIDLGSSSIRAGVLHGQPTLPQLFMPAVMTTSRDGQQVSFGRAALRAETRAAGSLCFPLRPSSRITKYSVDVAALEGLLSLVFGELRVDPSQYDVQLSLPRSFNTATLARILGLLFDTFGARGVNLTHQSILAMWSYNATSGVVVDIGDRMDVVPVIDGYIVEGGVSRVPYGGSRIQEHLRHFLLQKRYSLNSEIESFIIRYVMENVCFVAERYSEELQRFHADPQSLEKAVSVKEFLGDNASWRRMELDCGRFQSTEGLFSPDAWGLDSKGVHKLVHKAVQECSVDIRKEMVKSIYLAGGVTLLPGFAERLQAELDKLTPPSVTPKVHASPYRYHAAYLGACVLAASDGFQQAKVSRDSWNKMGASALNKWTV